jgi:dihydroneopterin aldolase
MKNVIEVSGIKLYAYHGCMEEEAKIGGKYQVDVWVNTDFEEAAKTDDLNKTVDYVSINQIVAEEMAIRSKLIEQVGYRMVKRIENELTGILGLRLKITKISPPINGDVSHVAIIIESGQMS